MSSIKGSSSKPTKQADPIRHTVQNGRYDPILRIRIFRRKTKRSPRKLMLLGGKNIELHYKEYFGALPWRGFSKFVVDSIVTKTDRLPADRLRKRNDNKLLRSRSKRLRPFFPEIFFSVRLPESADSTHVASFPTLHRFVLASDAAQQPIPLHPASAVRISGPGAASLLVRTERVDRRTLCG